MCKTIGKLTVYFENPFWVGVFERIENEKLSACKVIFGAEPKDCEILEYVLRHYNKLKFGPEIQVEARQTADNPKRRRRNAEKQVQNRGIGTKSQQALAAQREKMKTESSRNAKERREEEKRLKFDLKQQKRKEKHRGH